MGSAARVVTRFGIATAEKGRNRTASLNREFEAGCPVNHPQWVRHS